MRSIVRYDASEGNQEFLTKLDKKRKNKARNNDCPHSVCPLLRTGSKYKHPVEIQRFY
jgi:hypothetical protein